MGSGVSNYLGRIMKIAIAQINTVIGDVDFNVAALESAIYAATEGGAEAVFLADQCITGMPLMDIADLYKPVISQKVDLALSKLVALSAQLGIDVILQDHGVKHLSGGKIRSLSAATSSLFPLSNTAIVNVKGRAICVKLQNRIFSHGAAECCLTECLNALTIQTASLSSLAGLTGLVKGGLPFVYVNQACGATDTLYYGGSFFIDSCGGVVRLPMFEPRVQIVDLDNASLAPCADWGSRVAQIYGATVFGIREYFSKNNFSECCIALSGGIDSAVVVALAVVALGADRVRVIMLPSSFSSSHSVDDSLEMVRRTGIKHADVVPIAQIMEAAESVLKPVFGELPCGLAHENMQSRIRLMLTMALSNQTGALMLNTSNKSEIAVGYGTLYGDTSGALSIIGDLYKGEVYELAQHINIVANNIIPENIISKEPSAELRPDQFDIDSLPPYHVLDRLLYLLVEQGYTVESLQPHSPLSSLSITGNCVLSSEELKDLDRVARLLWNGDFKRHQLPPILRLSGATFNADRHFPITKCPFSAL